MGFKESVILSDRLPELPLCFDFYKRPLCNTLINALDMSKSTTRTSRPSSSDLRISWVIDSSWLIHELPGLNRDWSWEIKLFYVKNSNILIYKILSIFFSDNRKQRYGSVIFQYMLISFLMCKNYICFFHSKGSFQLSRHDLNISSSGLQREISQSFTIHQIIVMGFIWAQVFDNV